MITIVTGLPRSGTSLMMQLLAAGGIEILTDNIRKPDENNRRGYFEYEKVKSLQKDNNWLSEAEGKAVKVIAQLVPYLSPNFDYAVIFMKRNLDEIILSQEKMLENLGGKKATVGNDVLKKVFENQAEKCLNFLSGNKNFKTFIVDFNELLSGNDKIIEEIDTYLGLNLDTENAKKVIDSSLYRSRVK